MKRKKAVLSDSEDEDEEKADKPGKIRSLTSKDGTLCRPHTFGRAVTTLCFLSSAVKRSRAVSDDENSDSDVGGPDKSMAAKLRELGSDSGSEDDEGSKAAAGKKDEKALFGSDSESGDGDEEE